MYTLAKPETWEIFLDLDYYLDVWHSIMTVKGHP